MKRNTHIRLWVALIGLLSSAQSAMAVDEPALKKSFSWDFDGLPQTLTVDLSTTAYLHYRSRPRSWSYGSYVKESDNFPIIADFATTLEEAATLHTDNEWDRVRYAVSFVQHIKYSDDAGGEYPRYPVETLVDGTGDCEDTAILLAAILDAWGVDVVLLSPPKHMAVGLAVEGFTGTFYPYGAKRYYYVETTGKNWSIGEVPPNYAGSAKIYELESLPGQRRSVEYVAPKEDLNAPLQFVVYRHSTHGAAEGRVSYTYKVRLEGSPALMKRVSEVRYQRQHTTFPEYRDGNWMVKSDPGKQFEASWSAWRSAPIAVQVEFKTGKVAELLIQESAFESAR